MNLLIELLKTTGDFLGVTAKNAAGVTVAGYVLITLGLALLLGVYGVKVRRKRVLVSRRGSESGFTLLELLTVIAIIIVLAALILSTMGYAQQRAAGGRVQAEIQALSVALERYRVDNGEYANSAETDALSPIQHKDPNQYKKAGGHLAVHVIGVKAVKPPAGLAGDEAKKFKAAMETLRDYGAGALSRGDMLSTDTVDVVVTGTLGPITVQGYYLIDPFGYGYGYSTRGDYNPEFDLWSTGGRSKGTPEDLSKWITNW